MIRDEQLPDQALLGILGSDYCVITAINVYSEAAQAF